MGGLGFVVVIVLYVWLAVAVVKAYWRRNWKSGTAALAVMILLPTTDAVIGRLYLKHLCATEGGLHVKQVVKEVEGFYGGVTTKDFPNYYGYTFVEGSSNAMPRPPDAVERFIIRDGNVVKEDPVPPMSLYELVHVKQKRGPYFDETSWIVLQRSDHSELGRYDVFTFRGGWAEWLLGGFADGRDSVAVCGNIPFHGEKIVVQNTLIPNR